MRQLTMDMINEYHLKKHGFDFMGYTFDNVEELNFHHLIIPKKDSARAGIGNGYYKWNGAILVQNTAHEYLHIIEYTDREIFLSITQLMIRENLDGLSIETLRSIRELLIYFEQEHLNDKNSKGKPLIRTRYIEPRIKL